MGEVFEVVFSSLVLASGIRLAVPYLLAGLGETIGQRAGVLNLGVDGVMQLAAFFAYWTVLSRGSLILGMLVALAVGIVMGALYALITVRFEAEQGISGIGIFLFGLGFSDLMFEKQVGTPRFVPTLETYAIPGLSKIPVIGEALFNHSLVTYMAFALVPILAWMLRSTTFGMNVRAVGENPQAADSLGVSVAKTRVKAILIGNAMAGLAGGALVLTLGVFQVNLTAGLGFIAVALVYFGAWRPVGIMVGALLYGLVAAVVVQLKAAQLIPRDYSDFAAMAPALITIAALVILAGRVKAPSALTRPFARH